MNILDFNQSGGFPLSTEILEAMQASYRSLNELGKIAGDLTIISGCEVVGSVASDGFVVINGELFFFKGATVGTHVIIQQVAEAAQGFEDGSAKPIIYERYATFGTAETQYAWLEFRRPLTLLQIEAKLTQLEKSSPIGMCVVWGRPESEIPEGWVVHEPLQGYVAVGRKDGDVNFGALNATIGVAQVTLDITQIPNHKHSTAPFDKFVAIASDILGANSTTGLDSTNENTEIVIGNLDATKIITATEKSIGGGQSHTNIQPSRIVDWIRFVGFN